MKPRMKPRINLTIRKVMALGAGLGAVCGLITYLVQPHPSQATQSAPAHQAQAIPSSTTSAGNSSNTSSNGSNNSSSSNTVTVTTSPGSPQSAQQSQVVAAVSSLMHSSSAVDASSFVQSAFSQAGVSLPRTVQEQCQSGSEVSSASALQPGDLVCFDLTNSSPQSPTFDGIYVGNGQFAALTTHGAQYIRMDDPYWSGKFLYGRRIL